MTSTCGLDPVREPLDTAIARLAADRFGVFTRAQAVASGATAGTIHRRVRSGAWQRVHPGVYRLTSAKRTWKQTLLIACLAWDGVISHRAAAALWRLAGFEPGIIELLVPRGRDRAGPGVVHRTTALAPVDVTTVDGIPVTTVARTLIDLAAVAPREVLEVALDDALQRNLVSIPRLRWRLAELRRPRRRGAAVLDELIAARTDPTSRPKSPMETKLLRLIRRSGLPIPVVQHPIRNGARVVAVADLAYPDHKLAIEADGFTWHGKRERWRFDLARRNALTDLGWRVIHLTKEDIEERPDETAALIARALSLSAPRGPARA